MSIKINSIQWKMMKLKKFGSKGLWQTPIPHRLQMYKASRWARNIKLA